MLKKLTVPFVLSALVCMGITACNRSDSTATAPQSESSPSASNAPNSSSDNNQAKAYQTTERSRRREAIRKQIEAVLTKDQAQQLEAKLQQGEKMRQALSELNLTPEQKTKIQEVVKAARTQKPAEGSQQ